MRTAQEGVSCDLIIFGIDELSSDVAQHMVRIGQLIPGLSLRDGVILEAKT